MTAFRPHSFARCARSLRSVELFGAAFGRTQFEMVGPAEPDPTMAEGGSRSAPLGLPPLGAIATVVADE